MTEKPYVNSVDIGFLKGQINGVTIQVRTSLSGDVHSIHFARSTSTRGDSPISRTRHSHPWGDKVRSDPHDHANDAIEARDEARAEMKRRGLLDEEEWHDG